MWFAISSNSVCKLVAGFIFKYLKVCSEGKKKKELKILLEIDSEKQGLT